MKTNEVRAIDANALLAELQELWNQEVVGNTVSDIGFGISLAMQKTIVMKTVSLNDLRDAIYWDAVAHGLWDGDTIRWECAALIRSEVDELLCESTNWEDDGTAFAEGLSDVIIMSLSVAGKLGIDIDAAVKRKMEINKRRPWKHGKEDA